MTSYKGRTQPIQRKKIATAAAGRVCKWKGCETRLTIYNPNVSCYLHTPKRIPRIRGRDRKKAKAMGLGVDTSIRCYSCAISLGGWGGEAVEVQGPDGEWHWWVPGGDVKVKLCQVQ